MVGKVTVKIFCVWGGGGGGLNAIQKWLDSPEDESPEMLLRDRVITFTSHFPPSTLFSVSFFIACAQYYPLCCNIVPCCTLTFTDSIQVTKDYYSFCNASRFR
jgi:hypothetical protein